MSNPLQNTHWFNFPETKSKEETLSNPFLISTMKLTGLENYPIIIHMGNGYLQGLESFNHTQTEKLYLNNQGLHIFLYEPLCQFIENKKHNRGFYTEFLADVDFNFVQAEELESIKKYVTNNQLTNVTVHTCDYRADVFFPIYKNYFKIVCNDLFLKNYSVFETNINKDFKKHFICLNWRHTKHRHIITAFLAKENSYFSWYFKSSFETLNSDLWFNFDDWAVKESELCKQVKFGLEILNKNCPTLLDISEADPIEITDPCAAYYPTSVKYFGHNNPALGNNTNKILENFYNNSFCDIVNETRFAQHTGNFSEKLFQPIRFMTPFILAAPPETLKYAREYGFKTFNEFWNEDYDKCFNHEERMIKILKLIKQIGSMSLTECQNLYEAMIPTLRHNYNILVEKSPFKEVQKAYI